MNNTALRVTSRRVGIGLIGVIVALVFMVGMAYGDGFTENGFDLTLKNDTEVKQEAWLYVLDSSTGQWRNLYDGNIQPGAMKKLENKYGPGDYIVAWEGKKEGRVTMSTFIQYKFTVKKTVRRLTFTPDGLIHVAWNGI